MLNDLSGKPQELQQQVQSQREISQNGLATVMITHNTELAARAQSTAQIKDGLVHP